MNTKRIIGIIILIIGIIVIIFANHLKGRIADAQGKVQKGTSLFGDNEVAKGVGGAVEGKIGSYNTPVMLLMIGGIVIAVIGAGMAICCKKKKR